jgi:hypothetical protein
MTPQDLEALSTGITALGGQRRAGITRDVTHFFAIRPGSDKYETAMHFQPDTHVKVVLAHWFNDDGVPRSGEGMLESSNLRRLGSLVNEHSPSKTCINTAAWLSSAFEKL